MKPRTHLLIIDPQNDFCDLPTEYLPLAPYYGDDRKLRIDPALPVPGAHKDMLRLADFIRKAAPGLDAITVTLDSHHRVGIERTTFWKTPDGKAVSPFTQIKAGDVRAGRYMPPASVSTEVVLAYLDALESAGRYQLMVWPVHCELGTWGHNVHWDVRRAYNAWEEQGFGVVQKVLKGLNPLTEHYSALKAEVPDDLDDETQLNRPLIARLAEADRIVIGGETSSHCVLATTEHLVDNLREDKVATVVLLTDCISPVSGFGEQEKAFFAAMQKRGVRLATSVELGAELLKSAS